MQRSHRVRPGLLAASVALALALAGCSGDGADTGTSTSAASDGSTTTSDAASTTSSSSSTSTPSDTSTVSGDPDQSPDPQVTVTPAGDEPQSSAQAKAGMAAADATAPATRMRIPAVGLTTQIEPQGLRGGKVNPAAGQVIWFTGYDRARPGAVGTTVVAGHVIANGRADAFAALEQLSKGDGVVLDYPGGEKLRFEVTSTRIVDKDELTTSKEVWGDNDDTRRVVLITCDDELGFRTDGHRKANFVAVAELPG
ncbi:class F sortase [Janibacter anophelis]|uniref:class F sortase n=1 Tax=Janibacter anophelis TaxID=319054 RepID=UPI000B1A7A07|nr:class F sortase [Janibacter anophelis]